MITPGEILPGGVVVVDDGLIVEVLPATAGHPRAEATLDASGLTLAPGFIELQINGGFGYDLTADPGSIWRLGRRLPELGVTAFLPTIISSPPKSINHALEKLRAGPPPGYRGAAALGLHLEGPFLSRAQRGAHQEANLRIPSESEARAWSTTTGVAMVTLAPELQGSIDLIRVLSGRGVVVGAGHSAADLDESHAGIRAGVTYGTHVFNAMSGLDHRSPGLAAALLADPRVTVGLIADGIHVHPELILLAWRLAGPDRFSLVSDAMAGLGQANGRYRLGAQAVIVKDSTAKLMDGTLAGSVLRLDQAVRNLVAFTGCEPELAIKAVTAVPARLLRLAQRRGVIRPGATADIVLLTDHLEIAATIIRGEIVWSRDVERRRVGVGRQPPRGRLRPTA